MLLDPTVVRSTSVTDGYLELILEMLFLAKLSEKPVREILGEYLWRSLS